MSSVSSCARSAYRAQLISFNSFRLFNKIRNSDVHISFDVDSLDPLFFPLTGTPVPNGLTIYEVKTLLYAITHISNVFKLDVCEYNPTLIQNIVCNELYHNQFTQHEIDSKRLLKTRFHNAICSQMIINDVLAPVFGHTF
jgi:hypothetical protein